MFLYNKTEAAQQCVHLFLLTEQYTYK